MPQVKFERIVSCSSEDPAHPAKNLLLKRDYNKKWKCKEPGEESVTVVIQLEQPYILTGIDIGNESSSFVEVFVSRSSTPDDFQVLLSMSSFMTPMDARSESNRNRVRMFTAENLSESVRKEKWDRIKVVCTQPFNKHFQYGLSFIVLHSTEQKMERSQSPAKNLGRFTLKDEDDINISVGTFFSRRKDFVDPSPSLTAPLTGAAAVRDASSPASLAALGGVKKRKKSENETDSQKKKRAKPREKKESGKETSESPKVNGKRRKNSPEKTLEDRDTFQTSSSNSDHKKDSGHKKQTKDVANDDDLRPSSSSQQNQPAARKRAVSSGNITYKPFSKLFEGVEIVISGYVNPGRAEIREKALQMGAKYKPDWCSSSTHLICAFANTPKFQQVKGKGIIVTRTWVDDCFQERKKLSWRRYAVDSQERTDANITSDPEVWELIPGMDINNDSPMPPVSRRNDLATQDTRLGSDSEDSEDEIERIRNKQKMKEKVKENKLQKEVNHRKESTKVGKENGKDKIVHSNNTKEYSDSTDIDSEEEAKNRLMEWCGKQKNERSKDSLPPLPDFFKDKTFYLAHDISDTEKQSISRYITAFGGEILATENKSVHYIIAKRKQTKPEGSRSVCVTPDWIWKCNDSQRLVPSSIYEL